MPFTLAVAGKGGTGKTTLSALMIASLMKAGKAPVLAVDADPNANLNEALGVECHTTVVETVDEIMGNRADVPAGVSKRQVVEYEVHDALIESKGFDLMVMGRTEGPGCYCYANDLLKGFLEKLSSNYSYVVMDNEAGMEHLSRRTTRNVSALLIVANPTAVSLRSAARIYDIVQGLKLNIDKSFVVLNRLNSASPAGNGTTLDTHLKALEEKGLPILGEVAYDDQVATYSLEAKGILDLPDDSAVFKSVGGLLEKLGV